MFGKGEDNDRISDAQKALEERGEDIYVKWFNKKGEYEGLETIAYKDDYLAVVNMKLRHYGDGYNSFPYVIACSDLTKEGYTCVYEYKDFILFQKLPK